MVKYINLWKHLAGVLLVKKKIHFKLKMLKMSGRNKRGIMWQIYRI